MVGGDLVDPTIVLSRRRCDVEQPGLGKRGQAAATVRGTTQMLHKKCNKSKRRRRRKRAGTQDRSLKLPDVIDPVALLLSVTQEPGLYIEV